MGVQSFYTTFPKQTVVVHDYSVMCLHALITTHIYRQKCKHIHQTQVYLTCKNVWEINEKRIYSIMLMQTPIF